MTTDQTGHDRRTAGLRLKAPLLLLLFGTVMGSAYALARFTTEAGVPPLSFVFWQCFGGFVGVSLTVALARRPVVLGRRALGFYLGNGLLGLTLPYIASMLAVPHIGAGLPAVLMALSAVFTYLFAVLLGMERFRALRAAGLVAGVAGAALIVIGGRGIDVGPGGATGIGLVLWTLVATLAPMCTAGGNIFRARFWPAGIDAAVMSAGMLFMASVTLLPLVLIDGLAIPGIGVAAGLPGWILIGQGALTAIAYLAFFELQRIAGVIYFAQVGFIMTGTGLVWGVLVFGERYGGVVWLGVGLLAAGLLFYNLGLRRIAARGR
ncbi:DMT family transporter [Tistrella bauzanensis]|uniref:DMT family transporter n=1 Tax=Tistrella TaxID=171436 RepID=UPI0031F6447E